MQAKEQVAVSIECQCQLYNTGIIQGQVVISLNCYQLEWGQAKNSTETLQTITNDIPCTFSKTSFSCNSS